VNILWLQSAGCGGCTMSLLCAESPNLFDLFASAGLEFLWHPSLSEASGAEVRRLLEAVESGAQKLDILCIEGSIVHGPKGTGRYHMLAGTGRSMLDWLQSLAPKAEHVIAVGTCATYGGVTSAGDNPADATGLQYDGRHPGAALPASFRSQSGLPVINISGCPVHPDWVAETLLLLSQGELGADDLDIYARPRFYTDTLVHHACPKNEFYEYKASAEELSQIGCMMEHLGCIGTQAVGDCNIRLWNGEGSCTRAGYPCINCTAPNSKSPATALPRHRNLRGFLSGCPPICPKLGSWRWPLCPNAPRLNGWQRMLPRTGLSCPLQ